MPATNSPSRPALTSKSTNTFLRFQSHDAMNKSGDVTAATVQSAEAVTSSLPTYHASSSSPRAGQKRGREDTEQEGTPHTAPSTHTLGDLVSEKSLEQENEDVDMTGSSALRSSTNSNMASASSPVTLLSSSMSTSFHASQEPPNPIEETFEIREEVMSQQTLEKIHAVKLKFSQCHSTSQLLPSLRPTLTSELSQDSTHMSSFINYSDSENEKGNDEDMEGSNMAPLSPGKKHSNPSDQIPTRVQETEDPAGNTDLAEKAATLRTRLQLALYKVQTNQTARPFSRLQKPRAPSPDLPELPDLPAVLTPSLVTRQPSGGSSGSSGTLRGADEGLRGRVTASPESRIAIARARSSNMNQFKPAIKSLNSMPVPVIKPGNYSARWVDDEQGQVGREPKTPLRTASDDLVEMSTAERILGVKGAAAKPLTSSVVKGEAANGLLELMRASGVVGAVGMCGV